MTLYKSPLRLIPGFRWPREIMGSPMLPFDFNLPQTVFTPGMAKRATGLFTAPIFQGAWDGTGTPDEVTFARGTLRGNQTGLFYDTLDPHQGTISFRITPEWDGDDGVTHTLFGTYITSPINVFKRSDDILFVCHDLTILASVNVAAWTAGTTYYVVVRWNSSRTLDGTNHGCISVNAAETFGGTVSWTPVTPVAAEHIGSNDVPEDSANAIIEGLRIDRFCWYDGQYGDDLYGGVDVIDYAYNGGAGRDPARLLGGFDECLGVPTDATPGAFVTGIGEAHRFPWENEELDRAFCDDGYGPNQHSVILFHTAGADTYVDLTSNLVFDDMPDGANGYQFGVWIRFDGVSDDRNFIVQKGSAPAGWAFTLEDSGTNLYAIVKCFDTHAAARVYFADNPQWEAQPDGKWHWILMSFRHADNGGDGKIYIQVDGKWAVNYNTQAIGVGAYQSDAALTLYYGHTAISSDGAGGWLALWDDVTTYPVGTDNIPPKDKPGAGGNLIEAWQCDDRVNAITATVTTPANDGLLANGTWSYKWFDQATPVVPVGVEMNDGDVDFASGANIDNLPPAGFTAEGWFRCDSPTGGRSHIISKGFTIIGWSIYVVTTGELRAWIDYAGDDCRLNSGVNVADGMWHHVAVTDDGVDTGYLWLDGIQVDSDTYAGVYTADAAIVCVAGNYYIKDEPLNGAIGWLRVSDIVRYTANFVPPDRLNPPGNDGNAHLLINMDDGAGATATDTSGNAYHGTITLGAADKGWFNSEDSELHAPGERIYSWGHVLGSDGAGDGMAHRATVIAETDYVIRASMFPDMSGRGDGVVQVWDLIGAAQIGADYDAPRYHGVHTGGNGSPTLTDAGARWPQMLVGWTLYNITDGSSTTVTAVDGAMTTATGVLGGGTDNDWDTGDTYLWRPPNSRPYAWHPWCEPYVVRTPVGCTTIEVRLLNSVAGVLGTHQVEVIESLVDNGDIEAALVGVPPIPPLSTNDGLDAGDTQAEAGIVHAGAQSIRLNAGAVAGELFYFSPVFPMGDFASIGGWAYTSGRISGTSADRIAAQASGAVFMASQSGASVWEHIVGIGRQVGVARLGVVGRGVQHYIDDVYAFLMANVTLTVTPAVEANCLESGGIRVVGRATCVQPVVPAALLQATQGWIRWRERPRRASANLDAFGEVPGSNYLMRAWGDATNYVDVYATALNNIRLEFNDGGGVHVVNWDCTGLIAEDAEYLFAVRWSPAQMQFLVDLAAVVTIVQPVNFALVPTVVYFGSRDTGDRQGDAVFINP